MFLADEPSSKTSPDGVLGGVSQSAMGESMPVRCKLAMFASLATYEFCPPCYVDTGDGKQYAINLRHCG